MLELLFCECKAKIKMPVRFLGSVKKSLYIWMGSILLWMDIKPFQIKVGPASESIYDTYSLFEHVRIYLIVKKPIPSIAQGIDKDSRVGVGWSVDVGQYIVHVIYLT